MVGGMYALLARLQGANDRVQIGGRHSQAKLGSRTTGLSRSGWPLSTRRYGHKGRFVPSPLRVGSGDERSPGVVLRFRTPVGTLPAVQKVPSTRPLPDFSPRSATLCSVSGPTDVGIPPGTVSRATAKASSEALTAAATIRLRNSISASGPVTSIIQPFMGFPPVVMTNRIAWADKSPDHLTAAFQPPCAERLDTIRAEEVAFPPIQPIVAAVVGSRFWGIRAGSVPRLGASSGSERRRSPECVGAGDREHAPGSHRRVTSRSGIRKLARDLSGGSTRQRPS